MQPDTNVSHYKTVTQVSRGERTFVKGGVLCRQWLVLFSDGYKAEVVKPEGTEPTDFKAGKEAHFRIGYRSPKGDEIEALPHNENRIQKIMSMTGHPATIALVAAKDHAIAVGASDPKTVMEYADLYYNWLIDKIE